MRVHKFVYDAGMSTRPEFYSGRGATTSDLDGQKLDKIHAAIGTHVGAEAAEGFVDLVAGIKKLSATDFLLEVQRLELNDWKWEPPPQDGNGIYAGSPLSGLATIIHVAAGDNERDETDLIRWSFLKKHRPEAMRDYSPYTGWRTAETDVEDDETVEDDDTYETDLRDDENDTLDEGCDSERQAYDNPYRRGPGW